MSLGLYAGTSGLIAIINSWIGAENEPREPLAGWRSWSPPGHVDGKEIRLLGDEVVPVTSADLPGDQRSPTVLWGSSAVVRRIDADRRGRRHPQVRRRRGASGYSCLGSGYYEVTAVREDSHAGQMAGEAKAFRHPPSPLESEVNRVIIACTWVLVPLAVLQIGSLIVRSVPIDEAAQTATAGLITLIPEGLVLLMSVTFAVAAVKLARKDTLVQQMSATESLASVDTICVDKTAPDTATSPWSASSPLM
jgi:magnesium-transporting ATPase (P-type)